MNETKSKSDVPKRSRWGRTLAWLAGGVVVLLVAAYFVVFSATFLKGVILPNVGKSLGMEVTVAAAQISPFSQVRLRDLKVQPPGGEPLLTVQEIQASYSLWSILGGNLAVSDVAIESPVVTVVENPDGTFNLDAFAKAPASEPKPKTSAPAKNQAPAKAMRIDIKKVALNNATIRLVKHYANGAKDVTEVTGLNFSIRDLKNGQAGKLELAAVLAVQKAAQTNAAAATLQAKLKGGFDFALALDLKPVSVDGNTAFTVETATGPLADLGGLAAKLGCQLTATELKELSFTLTKADAVLAEIRASGPFDPVKSEGRLKVEVLGIDRQALNLAGSASGMDFGKTRIACTNDLELSQGGRVISVAGSLGVAHLQVKQKERLSPTLDLRGDYAATVDQAASSAVLQTLKLTVTQDSRALVQMGLSSPLTIAWGNASGAVGDAALNLTVTNLSLADWKAFGGDDAPGGVVNLAAKLVSQSAGKLLAFEVDTRVDSLTTGAGDANVNQGNLHVQAGGSVANLQLLKLDHYQLEVARQGKSLVTVSGGGTFDSMTQDADLQVGVRTALAPWLAIPGANPTNGVVDFKGRVTKKQRNIALTGELSLAATDRARNTLQLDGQADISQADAITGSFKLAAGSLDVTRYYDLLSSLQPAPTNHPPAAAGGTAPPTTDQEPEALKLPLKNFTVDLNVGHLYLREVDVANWVATARLDGGHVVLQPCQFTLNSAPVKATTDLNLDAPGYVYDVTFDADAIPLTPLVDSFAPDRKGQIAGVTSLSAQVKGAGVTGANLRKHLTGRFSFGSTNLNLSIANVRSPLINSVINVIVGLPNLISNPTAVLGNLFGGSNRGGWADTLTSSPIEAIAMQATAGEGQVRLQSAEVQSGAFQAVASGRVELASILTNSTLEIPIQVSLSRPLAGQIGLVNSHTPTNAAYIVLPDFLKIEGTLGNPKANLDKLVLVELAAKAGGGVVKGFGEAGGNTAGSILNAAAGLFGGGKSATNNSTPASTNAAPAADPLKLVK